MTRDVPIPKRWPNSNSHALVLPAGIKPYYQEKDIAIFLGDCRDILPQLAPVDLVLTDPPYNFEACGGRFYGVKWHGLNSEPREYLNDLDALGCSTFDPADLLKAVAFETAYFCCNKTLIAPYLNHATANGLLYDLLVMHKTNPIPAKNNHFLHDLEYIVTMRRKGSYFFCDDYDLMSKLFTTTVGNGNRHPAEKPIELFKKFIIVSCPATGTILDPFMGSGTTLRAAKDLGRKCIGIEIEEKYCEIAAKRLAQTVLQF